jgi:hypothetical protein
MNLLVRFFALFLGLPFLLSGVLKLINVNLESGFMYFVFAVCGLFAGSILSLYGILGKERFGKIFPSFTKRHDDHVP